VTDPAPRTETRLLFGLFFLSGMTALTAEVVLGKLLSYVFGSSHLATSTVLAAYMGGLSAGSLAFGRWVGRARSPIAIYAWLELAVGVFYGALPLAFGAFRAIALAATSSFRESPGTLTLVRFSLSFALVFAPTFLMGGTLPTLVAAFRSSAGFERRLSALYAVNTLGAAAGALLASYAAIPLAGLDGTLFLASGINVLVAVVALRLPRGRTPDAQPGEVEAREVKDEGGPRLGRATALGFAATQGVLSFSLQVVWFHLIGCVIGVTVYAFSIMLSVILLGIGAGSLFLPRLRGRLRASSAVVFGGSAIVMGVGVALSLLLWIASRTWSTPSRGCEGSAGSSVASCSGSATASCSWGRPRWRWAWPCPRWRPPRVGPRTTTPQGSARSSLRTRWGPSSDRSGPGSSWWAGCPASRCSEASRSR
jgi:spermidine synthase